METPSKPTHARPSLYAYYYFGLKEIALEHGYNLVVHGSMNRDLDLIAIPWVAEVKPYEEMMDAFMDYLGGRYLTGSSTITHHGRRWYVINLNRGELQRSKEDNEYQDPQYYIDISIMPTIETLK